MMKLGCTLFLLLGLCWPTAGWAQTPARQLVFKPFFIHNVPEDSWYYLSGGQELELRAWPGRIGQGQSYTGGGNLVFYTKALKPDGEVVRTPVAQATLPTGSREVILIFNQSPGGGAWQVLALPAGERDFPEGAYYLSNLTGDQVVFKIGDEIVSLVPGRFDQVRPDARRTLPTEVQAARNVGGEPRIVYRSQWPSYEGRRNLVLVYNDPGSRRGLLVQRFMEPLESQP